MIDLRKERPVLLGALAKQLGVKYETVRKWWKRGTVLDPSSESSERVTLETIRLTNGRHTSQEAYQRFIDKINHARGIEHPLGDLPGGRK